MQATIDLGTITQEVLKMSEPQGLLPFKLPVDTSSSIVTSFAGLSLVVEMAWALRIPELVERHVKVNFSDR